jgi:tetratricopeptide (TPR) repeat protein
MRRGVLATAIATAAALACADYRQKPTFPENAAHQPVLNEQAVLGLSNDGSAAIASLIDADGEPAQLRLQIFDAGGAPTKTVLEAAPETARKVSQELQRDGQKPLPLLEAAVRARWPEAFAKAAGLGFPPRAQAVPEPGLRRFAATGAAANGSLPLVLHLDEADAAMVLSLTEKPGGSDLELARMTLSGAAIEPRLYLENGVVWLLAGSVREGAPLHRAVGVRRGLLSRGEAGLHNLHGLDDYAAGELDAARREFARAIAADDTFFDSLYNAAAVAALTGDDAQALAFLKRAAAADPARVQVLGRNDEDLRQLRKRKDVRDLLGLHRPPPENVSPPP